LLRLVRTHYESLGTRQSYLHETRMANEHIRQLVEAIQVESDPGKMAALAAALNSALDESTQRSKPSALAIHPIRETERSTVQEGADKIRILVADDNEVVRKVLCDVLRSHPGYEVVCESLTAGDAIDKAKELQPNVVVLDISLPDMNGIDVVRQIREAAPSTRILLCSQHELEYIVAAGIAAGACGYLLKSDAVKELIPAIEAISRGEQYISSEILSTKP
jgi:CheY-like chemotaxis protein